MTTRPADQAPEDVIIKARELVASLRRELDPERVAGGWAARSRSVARTHLLAMEALLGPAPQSPEACIARGWHEIRQQALPLPADAPRGTYTSIEVTCQECGETFRAPVAAPAPAPDGLTATFDTQAVRPYRDELLYTCESPSMQVKFKRVPTRREPIEPALYTWESASTQQLITVWPDYAEIAYRDTVNLSTTWSAPVKFKRVPR